MRNFIFGFIIGAAALTFLPKHWLDNTVDYTRTNIIRVDVGKETKGPEREADRPVIKDEASKEVKKKVQMIRVGGKNEPELVIENK